MDVGTEDLGVVVELAIWNQKFGTGDEGLVSDCRCCVDIADRGGVCGQAEDLVEGCVEEGALVGKVLDVDFLA